MDTDKILEDEISKLKNSLQNLEDVDDGYLDDEIKELRHFIMFVHFRVERSLEVLLVRHVLGISGRFTEEQQEVSRRMTGLFDRMEFWPKVDACASLGLIDSNVRGLIDRVNVHRKFFSHPASYQEKIMEYKERATYRDTLKELTDTMNKLNNLFAEYEKSSQH